MKERGKPEAKALSLRAIVLGGVWVAAHSLFMALWPLWSERPYGLSMRDSLFSGVFLIVSWSPVYGSIWIDKFLGRKLDGIGKGARGPLMPGSGGLHDGIYPGGYVEGEKCVF
ncbi:MAG: hypothetical protein LBF77_00790 [Spirochaetaceae bacterium]|jgi:hypothetical protein|nr:hypothetical protein [Spirochaetaceae bacterium]